MKEISNFSIYPGMILAKPVYQNDVMLIEAGTVLTRTLISKIRRMSDSFVAIEDMDKIELDRLFEPKWVDIRQSDGIFADNSFIEPDLSNFTQESNLIFRRESAYRPSAGAGYQEAAGRGGQVKQKQLS